MFPQLQQLTLVENKIQRIEAFQHESLEFVDFSGNLLESLIFKDFKLPNLKTLVAKSNQLAGIDLTETGAPSLSYLDACRLVLI